MAPGLREAGVPANGERFEIYYEDGAEPVARVGRVGAGFAVEFVAARVDRAVRHAVLEEVWFYLCDKGEPDPWAYARYHAGSASSLYSDVRWVYVQT